MFAFKFGQLNLLKFEQLNLLPVWVRNIAIAALTNWTWIFHFSLLLTASASIVKPPILSSMLLIFTCNIKKACTHDKSGIYLAQSR